MGYAETPIADRRPSPPSPGQHLSPLHLPRASLPSSPSTTSSSSLHSLSPSMAGHRHWRSATEPTFLPSRPAACRPAWWHRPPPEQDWWSKRASLEEKGVLHSTISFSMSQRPGCPQVCTLGLNQGGGGRRQVHGGRPRSLRGCHALAPTPQGQPYQASPQRLFMSSGTGRGCPPTPQPYIWITRSSPCLDKNTTFAPPARFSMQIQLTSLFLAGRAALAKYWRQVCRRLRGSKAVCSPGKSQDSPDLSM